MLDPLGGAGSMMMMMMITTQIYIEGMNVRRSQNNACYVHAKQIRRFKDPSEPHRVTQQRRGTRPAVGHLSRGL